MVSKLRADNNRQEPEQDAMGDQAVLDLAASALFDDPDLLGLALVLLSMRTTCSIACGSSGRRLRSIRERDFGPIDSNNSVVLQVVLHHPRRRRNPA
jgi:hypothetical protein